MDQNRIIIDLDGYANQLRGDISSDLTTLQIINTAIASDNYSNNSYTLQQGIMTSVVPVSPIEFLKQREINKCFKSIVGSLQDYMDKLIAVIRLVRENIVPPPDSTNKDIEQILQSKFAFHLMKVSADHSLKIPNKLEMLLGSPENHEIKVSVQSFFDVRNGLEHHKGIAKKDREMKYLRLALASTSGKEVIPQVTLGVEEGLVVKAFEENIFFDEGGNLTITKNHLDGIILNILSHVIPAMKDGATKKINAK